MQRLVFLTCILTGILSAPAIAAETQLQLNVDVKGDVKYVSAQYQCDPGGKPLEVEYVNAAPNHLALIEIDGEKLIFASTPTGSGVRYSALQYTWWGKGDIMYLSDFFEGPDAAPVLTCTEIK